MGHEHIMISGLFSTTAWKMNGHVQMNGSGSYTHLFSLPEDARVAFLCEIDVCGDV